MGSHLISFRLSDAEIEALKAKAEGDESLNLIAQRLLRELLGVKLAPELTNSIQTEIEALKGRLDVLEAVIDEKVNIAVNKHVNQLTLASTNPSTQLTNASTDLFTLLANPSTELLTALTEPSTKPLTEANLKQLPSRKPKQPSSKQSATDQGDRTVEVEGFVIDGVRYLTSGDMSKMFPQFSKQKFQDYASKGVGGGVKQLLENEGYALRKLSEEEKVELGAPAKYLFYLNK